MENWILNDGLDEGDPTEPIIIPITPKAIAFADGLDKKTPPGKHPSAYATFDAWADEPKKVGVEWQITAGIDLFTKTQNVDEDPGGHTDQVAKARSYGQIKLNSGKVRGVNVKENGKVVKFKGPKITKKSSLFPVKGKIWKNVYHDPITLSFSDVTDENNVITHDEELMALDMETNRDSEMIWTAIDGLILDVALDGVSSAAVQLNINSDWVTNWIYTSSELSLVDGVFTATGIFDSPHWQLSGSPGDYFYAFLPPEYLPEISMLYEIPENMILDNNYYEQTLFFDSIAESHIPEPASATLLLTCFGYLFKRRIVYHRN